MGRPVHGLVQGRGWHQDLALVPILTPVPGLSSPKSLISVAQLQVGQLGCCTLPKGRGIIPLSPGYHTASPNPGHIGLSIPAQS